MKVICIKLSSGEEIIARLASSSFLTAGAPTVGGGDLTVGHVRVLGIHEDPRTRQIGIGLTPWSLGNQDGDVTINREHITAIYEPVKHIEDSYVQDTTPIKLASSIPGMKM